MKKTITLLLLLFALAASAQQAADIEKKLNGGDKKRWIFSKSQLSMGKRITPLDECYFKSLTFSSNKKVWIVSCTDNKSVTLTYNVTKLKNEEYYLELSGIKYEVLVYTEKLTSGQEKEVLLLRINATMKEDKNKEYYYYGE